MIVSLNGDLIEEGALIDVRDRGFLLGDGVFETMLVRNRKPIFLSEHLQRMAKACADLRLVIPRHLDDALNLINALINRNELDDSDHSCRITLSRGSGQRGLLFPPMGSIAPTMLITIAKSPARTGSIKIMMSQYCRSSRSVASRHKTLTYLDNIMARNEAAKLGYDEAVMRNEAGRVACGSMSNIFMIDAAGTLHTPAISEGALPGIVRAKLIGYAARLNAPVREGKIFDTDLNRHFSFLTNSLMGILPVDQNIMEPPALFTQLVDMYTHEIEAAMKLPGGISCEKD